MKKTGFSIYILLSIILFCSCKDEEYTFNHNPHVIINCDAGNILVELYADKAPLTANPFIKYADSGYFNETYFYRVLNIHNQPMDEFKAELIQGGTYLNKDKPKNLPGTPHEPTNKTGLKHLKGSLSMARMDTGTATTEFFICLEDQKGYDFGGKNNHDGHGYAVFGQVVKGMEIVRKVSERPEKGQRFRPPVKINSIRIVHRPKS